VSPGEPSSRCWQELFDVGRRGNLIAPHPARGIPTRCVAVRWLLSRCRLAWLSATMWSARWRAFRPRPCRANTEVIPHNPARGAWQDPHRASSRVHVPHVGRHHHGCNQQHRRPTASSRERLRAESILRRLVHIGTSRQNRAGDDRFLSPGLPAATSRPFCRRRDQPVPPRARESSTNSRSTAAPPTLPRQLGHQGIPAGIQRFWSCVFPRGLHPAQKGGGSFAPARGAVS